MMLNTDVDLDRLIDDLDRRLARADAALAQQFPGDRAGRQPVHTVYVPADRYRRALGRDWGDQAIATLDEHASTFAALVSAQGADAVDLDARVRRKLAEEPIEDLRIDFEDGYGVRSDEVEDAHVADVTRELAASIDDGQRPTVPRHPHEEPRGAHPTTRAAHPRCRRARAGRSPACRWTTS